MSYNSKYSGAQVEGILDSVGDKQDAISDLDAIRDGASKGATAVQSYIVPFDISDLWTGEIIREVHTDELKSAINEHKLILIPIDISSPTFGYVPMSAWVEDMIYFSVLVNDDIIYGTIDLNREEIYPSDIKIITPGLKQDALVSGENIKTINGESILGNGNIEISGVKKIVPNKQETTSFSFTYDSENGPLEPNKIYICHNTEILDVIISDIIPPEDLYGEYTCLFKFGGVSVDSLGLTLPDYVLWVNGTAPQLEVQTPYELSITATKFIDDYIYKAVLTPFKSI